ncbi:unnamed protein product [Adineta ricciae]|uniref:G-protein coupled receptors family 1 profile domain-containing protein n=1 Tax=Adineta ricciae TaxID=249248 RepID=A0A815EE08_ADIRI|nr:unnamed protein product [Adineta ricciae]
MSFILLIPLLTERWVTYLPECYFCQISFSSIQDTLYGGVVVYVFPTWSTTIIYTYIINYMKKTAIQSVLQKRHQTNQQDLVVLRRIIVMLGILLTLCFPTVLTWVSFVINNNINPIGYRIGWLVFALSFAVLPITLALLISQARQLLMTLCCARWNRI